MAAACVVEGADASGGQTQDREEGGIGRAGVPEFDEAVLEAEGVVNVKGDEYAASEARATPALEAGNGRGRADSGFGEERCGVEGAARL